MAAQQPSTVSEGTRKGRFTLKESAVDPSNPRSDDSVADDLGTAHVPTGVAQSPTQQETVCLASLHKLQEEFTQYHQNFRETWSSIEAQVRAMEDANSSSLVQPSSHDDLVGTVVPQQATRPNTPTSTSAYSTSSCTSRTPPATSCSEHFGHRLQPTNDIAKEKRENTLRMWSDLGDTLRDIVQRNLRLEEENHRLAEELKSVDQQVIELKEALAQESGGLASARSSLLDTDLLGSEIAYTIQGLGPELHQQVTPAPVHFAPSPHTQTTQPLQGGMERGRFKIQCEPSVVDDVRDRPLDKNPEEDGATALRHVSSGPNVVSPSFEQASAGFSVAIEEASSSQSIPPQPVGMERGRFKIQCQPSVVDDVRGRPLDMGLEEDGSLTLRHVVSGHLAVSPSFEQASVGLGAVDRPVEEASSHPLSPELS